MAQRSRASRPTGRTKHQAPPRRPVARMHTARPLAESIAAGVAAVSDAERELTESVRAAVAHALRRPGASAGQPSTLPAPSLATPWARRATRVAIF
jgi:hypothetical protein